ncbi:hypothetical protein LB507_007997 [Fusarium sp. FIESC RH6]|nr:hypothetical protein LB507_007997 [Fusarium sp. FIESC RH6]
MLSPAYLSISQQYKADTDFVATWLAATAKVNGFDEQTAAAKNVQAEEALRQKKKKKNGNRKGKGPSHAKALRPAAPLAQSSEGKYIIKVRDFEDMAKFVADTNSIEVPYSTALALERVI